MARVNYSFEKRRRELDKKSKKQAKAQRRAQEQGGSSDTGDGVPTEPLSAPETAPDASSTPGAPDPAAPPSQDR